jgi:hypothetical protein
VRKDPRGSFFFCTPLTIGANTHFEGIILGQTGITFGNLSSINGRLLAQSAVALDATTVTVP